MRRDNALKIANISKHQYYYQPKPGKQGRKKSTTVEALHGTVNNTVVVEKIMRVKNDPVTDYGYIKMSFWLQLIGYIINKKKVYDLMKTNCLSCLYFDRTRHFYKICTASFCELFDNQKAGETILGTCYRRAFAGLSPAG